MLRHLSIRNFAIVDELELGFASGMTAISGETGAGKSIMLDALGLVLGGRADSRIVSGKSGRAEISILVDAAAYPAALHWLAENQLDQGGDSASVCLESPESRDTQSSECLLRRVITSEGRSQAWINGRQVTLQQLKSLGNQLVNIHSQHEHQELLQRENHGRLLDAYGSLEGLAMGLSACYQEWKQVTDQITAISGMGTENNARLQLLRYQLDELDQLDLQEGELLRLEAEQKQLANAEELLLNTQKVLQLCDQSIDDAPAMMDLLTQAQGLLSCQKNKSENFQEAESLLDSARIHLEEACARLYEYQDNLEINPEKLQQVEQRLALIYQIARKHNVIPEQLTALYQTLKTELDMLDANNCDLSLLESRQLELYHQYQVMASELTKKRQKAASRLDRAINDELKRLSMSGSRFEVKLSPRKDQAHPQGDELVEFFIQTNPGQPLMPLRKVASGGELSRISLAIQVVTAQTSTTPTLVFDEVDVGIGGETAAIVGELLRKLGEKSQIICVTHQAAVAAKAHHHCYVSKSVQKGQTKTVLSLLEKPQRVKEVARMLGGEQSKESMAHAKMMLKAS